MAAEVMGWNPIQAFFSSGFIFITVHVKLRHNCYDLSSVKSLFHN